LQQTHRAVKKSRTAEDSENIVQRSERFNRKIFSEYPEIRTDCFVDKFLNEIKIGSEKSNYQKKKKAEKISV
jgi:hypothetical protein